VDRSTDRGRRSFCPSSLRERERASGYISRLGGKPVPAGREARGSEMQMLVVVEI